MSRRYRGCEMTPGPVFTAICDDGVRRPLHDGWVATCGCGWSERRFTQASLKLAITDHYWAMRSQP